MVNFLILSNPGIRYKQVMYIDTQDFLADTIFEQKSLQIKFSNHWGSKDYPEYLCIHAKVLKKDIPKFKECMNQLRTNQLVCGHKDYDKAVDKIMTTIIGGTNDRHTRRN